METHYLLEGRLFHTLGIWFEQAGLTDPPCFSEGSSWSCGDPGTSRSQRGLRLLFSGVCTGHWLTAQLWMIGDANKIRGL